ncbi:MAG: DUF2225 domain-containing protein [Lachnospiraceae bacterium]|nr:DUF2225 domain-containing protein [Lachnospiraceae bacterium]
MGIFSGLEGLGIDLKEQDLFADKSKEPKISPEQQRLEEMKKKEEEEKDLLIRKSYVCPCCSKNFKSLTVKANKGRLLDQDIDLRPRYDEVDKTKYEVVMCPECGYAARVQIFNELSEKQAKLVREKISQSFKSKTEDPDIYTYDESIMRYQMALANAMVRGLKSSEKAFLCLKMAWVIRGKKEHENFPADSPEVKKTEEMEQELLKNALEGFAKARSSESFPMCGMDQYTVDYILAALFYENHDYNRCLHMISELLTSQMTNPRIKEKARNLKDLIASEKK